MSQELKQSTAVTVQLGPYVDDTDGKTPETGLATAMDNATTGIRVSKNGAAMVDRNSATVPTHDEDGHYIINLDATDTNTLGRLRIQFSDPTTNLPMWIDFSVVTANYWDSKYSTDTLKVDLTEMGGSAQSAVDLKNFSDSGYDPITNKVQGVVLVDTVTALASTALDAIVSTATGMVEIAKAICDRIITGANHNIVNSLGRVIREIKGAAVLHDGTAQAATINTITLDTGASAIDGFYNHTRIVIIENTGLEQERIIVEYVGSTKVAKVAPPWKTTPDATSGFEIEPGLSHAETDNRTVKVGLAAAATASTITLDSDASSVNDFYDNDVISIDAGTGEGQQRIITAYNGTTKVATIEPDWITNPDTTSEYIVEEALVVADLFSISHSPPAADNLKLSTLQIIPGAAEGTPSATVIQTDLAETQDDIYIGRIIIFTSGAAKDEATEITDYVGSTGTLTVTALANAPAAADTFIII